MSIGIECDCIDKRHIEPSIHQYAFVSSDINHFANHAAAIFIILILDKLALQAQWEFIDDRSIYGFCLAGSKTAFCQLVRDFIAGIDAEVVGLRYMCRVCNADGESSSCLDITLTLPSSLYVAIISTGMGKIPSVILSFSLMMNLVSANELT